MSNEKSNKQQAAEENQKIQHQIEMGSKQVKNAKALLKIDEISQKEKDRKLQGRDLVNQMIGRTQMSQALALFTDLATTIFLKNVKENKLYKDLKGVVAYDKNGEEIANVGTWSGYCKAVGFSRQKADEDIANLDAFGEKASEAMDLAGIGYRHKAQLRTLAADDLATVITEVKENINDEQAIVSLIETTIIKHSKEKQNLTEEIEAVQKQLEETKADNKSKDDWAKKQNKKIDDLDKIVSKCLTPDEQRKHYLDQEQVLKNELSLIEVECAIAIDNLDLAMGKIYNHPKCSEELEQMPHKLYEYLLKHLVNVAGQYQMKFDANQILDPIMYNLPDVSPQDENG